jgi:hypothetical protein
MASFDAADFALIFDQADQVVTGALDRSWLPPTSCVFHFATRPLIDEFA